jgi:hypothetical protein
LRAAESRVAEHLLQDLLRLGGRCSGWQGGQDGYNFDSCLHPRCGPWRPTGLPSSTRPPGARAVIVSALPGAVHGQRIATGLIIDCTAPWYLFWPSTNMNS